MGSEDELEETRPLTPNRNGANLFLGPRFLGQYVCPLNPGDDCIARIIPHVGVVVLPLEADLDYPLDLTIDQPHSQPADLQNHDP